MGSEALTSGCVLKCRNIPVPSTPRVQGWLGQSQVQGCFLPTLGGTGCRPLSSHRAPESLAPSMGTQMHNRPALSPSHACLWGQWDVGWQPCLLPHLPWCCCKGPSAGRAHLQRGTTFNPTQRGTETDCTEGASLITAWQLGVHDLDLEGTRLQSQLQCLGSFPRKENSPQQGGQARLG